MRTRMFRSAVLAIGLLAVAASVFAHHGNAAYDTDKTVTMKGTVTQWLWINPHTFLLIDVKDDSGKVAHWSAEGSAPADMMKRGWNMKSISVGQEVTLEVVPAKSGQPVGRIVQVTLPDGKVLQVMQSGGKNNSPTTDPTKE